jgi:hypothetical protein
MEKLEILELDKKKNKISQSEVRITNKLESSSNLRPASNISLSGRILRNF